MANLIHRLVKDKSSFRILKTLNTPQLSKLAPALASNPASNIGANKPEHYQKNPVLEFVVKENAESNQPLRFYPSFPYGYCMGPIEMTAFDPLKVFQREEEKEEKESSDAGTMYADSVKKKRKKKMNKHKYKKLRKRLRRKS